jgi:hypothetical protein
VKNKKIYISILLVAVVVFFIVYLIATRGSRTSDDAVTGNNSGQISSEQSTDEAINPETIKRNITENEDKNNNTIKQDGTTSQKSAEIIIVDAAQYGSEIEVRSFINNYVGPGTCEFTFIQDNLSFSKTEPAYPDATTTVCPNISIDKNQFDEPGEWRLVVNFSSENYYGETETTIVIR